MGRMVWVFELGAWSLVIWLNTEQVVPVKRDMLLLASQAIFLLGYQVIWRLDEPRIQQLDFTKVRYLTVKCVDASKILSKK